MYGDNIKCFVLLNLDDYSISMLESLNAADEK